MSAFLAPACFTRYQWRTPAISSQSFPHRQITVMASRSLVWIRRGDMRTIDHVGLSSAANSDAAAAVIVINKEDDIDVVASLARALRASGIELQVLISDDASAAVAEFAREFDATCVHVHADETEVTRDEIRKLAEKIPQGVSVYTWRDFLRVWDERKIIDVPSLYPDFLNWSERESTPSRGTVVPEALNFPPQQGFQCLTNIEDVTVSPRRNPENASPAWDSFRNRYQADSVLANALTLKPDSLNADEYGERIVQEYLLAAEEYRHPDLGRSLAPVFEYGLLSYRRIYEIVIEHERLNGRIFRPFFREGAKRLLEYLDSREFTQLSALRDIEKNETVDGEHQAKFWRWRGFSIRYVEEGPIDSSEEGKPPLVLVHGFGASSQHFRRSIRVLKERFKVYAPDVIGYGRSEKVPTAYTQDLWECMIWEFIREVVGEPAYIAGNSIGGYFAASFASDAFPEQCKGVVLLNSAGRLEDPNEEASRPTPSNNPFNAIFSLGKYILRESRPARRFAASLILRNLQGKISRTLEFVYPSNPDAADDQLANEIYRNSLDYGAAEVLASGLVLPPPRSLTELLGKYSGPALVYQGVLDPLNTGRDRAEKLANAYPAATVVKRNVGHCPHDEDAENFARVVSDWMTLENEKSTTDELVLSVASSRL